MDLNEFKTQVQKRIPVGLSLDNPGGGTSKITGYSNGKISYVRGASKMYVALDNLHAAYSKFKGHKAASNDLKNYAPHIFDSNARPAGHSCNCTLLFLILGRLNLASNIKGKGVRGNPFYVHIYD